MLHPRPPSDAHRAHCRAPIRISLTDSPATCSAVLLDLVLAQGDAGSNVAVQPGRPQIQGCSAGHIKARLDAVAINVMRSHKYKSKIGNKALAKSQASPQCAEHETNTWLQSRG